MNNLGKIGNVQLTRPKTSGPPPPVPLGNQAVCLSLDFHNCSEDHTIQGRLGSTIILLKPRWLLVPSPRA